jgi:hypothetical protein
MSVSNIAALNLAVTIIVVLKRMRLSNECKNTGGR